MERKLGALGERAEQDEHERDRVERVRANAVARREDHVEVVAADDVAEDEDAAEEREPAQRRSRSAPCARPAARPRGDASSR